MLIIIYFKIELFQEVTKPATPSLLSVIDIVWNLESKLTIAWYTKVLGYRRQLSLSNYMTMRKFM